MRLAEPFEGLGDQARLLAKFAAGGVLGGLAVEAAALGDLPRIAVERVAVLADEPDRARVRRRAGRRRPGCSKWTTP